MVQKFCEKSIGWEGKNRSVLLWVQDLNDISDYVGLPSTYSHHGEWKARWLHPNTKCVSIGQFKIVGRSEELAILKHCPFLISSPAGIKVLYELLFCMLFVVFFLPSVLCLNCFNCTQNFFRSSDPTWTKNRIEAVPSRTGIAIRTAACG